jgi:hypothetical protein
MKRTLYALIAIVLSHTANAGDYIPLQKSRAIVGLGTSLYYGDINESFNAASQQLGYSSTIGIQIHASGNWYFTPCLTLAQVSGTDAIGTNDWRNLSFTSNLTELSTKISYFPTKYFDYNNRGLNLHPFISAGAGLLLFNTFTEYNDSKTFLQPLATEGISYSKFSPTLIVDAGFTWRQSENIEVIILYSFHNTFSDYLDDVSGNYIDNNSLTGQSADVADRSFEGGFTPTTSVDGIHWDEGQHRGSKKGFDTFGLLQIQIGISL